MSPATKQSYISADRFEVRPDRNQGLEGKAEARLVLGPGPQDRLGIPAALVRAREQLREPGPLRPLDELAHDICLLATTVDEDHRAGADSHRRADVPEPLGGGHGPDGDGPDGDGADGDGAAGLDAVGPCDGPAGVSPIPPPAR